MPSIRRNVLFGAACVSMCVATGLCNRAMTSATPSNVGVLMAPAFLALSIACLELLCPRGSDVAIGRSARLLCSLAGSIVGGLMHPHFPTGRNFDPSWYDAAMGVFSGMSIGYFLASGYYNLKVSSQRID